MSTSAIGSLSNAYLQSIIGGTSPNDTLSSIGGSSLTLQPDNGQLSPFARLMSTLQQLQQTDPAKYQQVARQIASNLQSAAQTAQSEGNTKAADQLNQLATDFSNASQNGQLPNVADLARAVGGHHHHHHAHAALSDPGSNDANGFNTLNQTLSQFLSSLQTNGAQNQALNPMNIVLNTLSSAGVNS